MAVKKIAELLKHYNKIKKLFSKNTNTYLPCSMEVYNYKDVK